MRRGVRANSPGFRPKSLPWRNNRAIRTDLTPSGATLRVVRRLLLSVLGIYLALAVLVWLLQRRMQYFPDPAAVPPPSGQTYAGLVEVDLETSDGVALKAWDWPGPRGVTLVFFHGNAGHRGHRLDWIKRFRALGWGVFIVDYRGYGGSEGAPTEEGLHRDADAVADHLEGRRLVYFGESLGCGVAVPLAARRPPEALVLQAGAISIAAVGQHHYPWLPVGLLMKDRYDCADAIAAVTAPVLCIHGERDRIVPMEFGRALFDAATEPKEWHVFDDAGHNDLPWARGYLARIHAFLEANLE